MAGVTAFSSSSSSSLESLGFDSYHRRDSALFPESIASELGDLDLGGEKIEYVHVSSLIAGEIAVDQNIRGGQNAYDTGVGFWLGLDGSTAKFSIGDSAGDKVTWNGSVLSITGSITATSGSIGGFDIGTDYIRDVANSFGLASTVTGSDDVRFWAGDTFANRATAPLRIYESGAIVGTSVTLSGGLNAEASFTAGEAVASGDVLSITSTDTVKRHSPTALPSSFDESSTLAGTFTYKNQTRPGHLVALSSSLYFFVFEDDLNDTIAGVRIPVTASSGAVGTMEGDRDLYQGAYAPRVISAVKMDSTRVLTAMSKSNGFQAAIIDLSSTVTVGADVSVDTTNVQDGFCEYISDSHVLFFSQDTSTGNIQFNKYTASGTTLTSSSSGTVTTTFAGDTYVIVGVRQFADSAYFLILSQNTTDATAYALVAHYDTGTSTFDSVGSPVPFTSVSSTSGDNAVLASLSSTEVICFAPTSTTAGVYFLVTRSSVTPTVGTLNSATARGANEGYSLTRVNARCAYLCTTSATTATYALLEINSAVTDVSTRVSSTTGVPAIQSGSATAAWQPNPVRMGAVGLNTSFDPVAVTGTLTIPPPAGIAKTTVASGASVTAIISGSTSNVSGLTAAEKIYADIGGLLTNDGNGSPGKIGVSKDTNELILRSW